MLLAEAIVLNLARSVSQFLPQEQEATLFVSRRVLRMAIALPVPTVVLRGFVSLHRLTRAQVLPMAMPVTLLIPMGLL